MKLFPEYRLVKKFKFHVVNKIVFIQVGELKQYFKIVDFCMFVKFVIYYTKQLHHLLDKRDILPFLPISILSLQKLICSFFLEFTKQDYEDCVFFFIKVFRLNIPKKLTLDPKQTFDQLQIFKTNIAQMLKYHQEIIQLNQETAKSCTCGCKDCAPYGNKENKYMWRNYKFKKQNLISEFNVSKK